jgi:cytochrome c-type biogenesis protein CcmE
LAILAVLAAGLAGYLAYLGASASWQYYLTVDECMAGGVDPGDRVRVSGKIVDGSLRTNDDRSEAQFLLEGTQANLPVICGGPLPDNLAENREVVVEGQIEPSGRLRGEKVLTRCESKYRSEGSSDGGPYTADTSPEAAPTGPERDG